MNDSSLISVIIPVYNAEKYIDRCMESIFNQTYKNLEVLLIDDGSADGSLNLCEQYSDKYSNIFVFSKKNGGAADARNFGIERAKGEYIAFVDIDDFIHPQYFEILYNNCVENECDISICQFEIVKDDLINNEIYKLSEQHIEIKSNIEMLYECCSIKKTAVVTPWSKIFRKEIFVDCRFPVGRTYEDLATAHKFMYAAQKVVISNLKLYYYYMSSNSVMRKRYSLLNFNSENQAQDERLEFYKQLHNEDLYQKLLISVQRNRVANYCKAKRYLPEYINERNVLREKFQQDYQNVDFLKCNRIDNVLFKLFRVVPAVCVQFLFPIYEYFENRKWS